MAIVYEDLLATELPQDLAARTAGEARRGVRAEDGDQFDLPVFRVRRGHRRSRVALSADREPVGGVLDIRAGVYGSAPGEDGRPDVEVAVRSVCPACGLAGSLHHSFRIRGPSLHSNWKAAVVTRIPITAPIITS